MTCNDCIFFESFGANDKGRCVSKPPVNVVHESRERNGVTTYRYTSLYPVVSETTTACSLSIAKRSVSSTKCSV